MTMESRSKASWLEPSYADYTSTKPQEDLIERLDDAYVTNEDGFSHTSENGSSENLQGGRLFEAVDYKNKRRVLIDIAVEIEDGKVEHIEIKDGDTAEEVATKFCHIHALPAQLVAPLTDHIVRNIMEISKEDHDIILCFQDDGSPSPEDWKNKEPHQLKPIISRKKDYHKITKTPESCFHRYCSSRLASKCTKQFRSAKESLSLSSISDRLLGPTFTSATKICSVSQKEAKEESRSPHELSSKMQELYMRLYNEYYLHKQRMDEVKKLYLEDYKREIQRGKPLASVKTRKFKSDRQKVAKQFQNYGDMLYQEGLLRDGEKRKYIEMKRREIEVAELKELTALPEISKLARQIKRGDEPVWDRLVHQRPNEDHLQELRCEVLQAQLMECTFRPRINQKLENLQDTKKVKLLRVSRFDQLFWDAEHRRKRRTGYGEWYPNEATFRPMINKSPKQSCSIAEVVQHRSVFDRLLEYAARVNEKRHKLYLSQEQLVDQETGQKLFQPLTGGKPLAKRNTDALPIGIFLHHLKPVYDSRRECLTEEDTQEFKKLANRRYVGAKSARLLKELRERSLRDIFHYLDTDKDGFVDLATANTELLTDEVVQNISELKKMQYDTDEHLSFEKFVQLMHIVWRRRRSGFHVVFRHSKACHGEKFAFQFKMDQYSRILAYHKRRFRSSKQWYKIILKDKQRRQAKVEAMRKERESIEMDACPFRPAMLERFGKSRLKLSHGSSKKHYLNPKSTAVQKDQQEVHGFIFQEAHELNMCGSEDPVSPLGLIESLKRMVAFSRELPNEGEKLGFEA